MAIESKDNIPPTVDSRASNTLNGGDLLRNAQPDKDSSKEVHSHNAAEWLTLNVLDPMYNVAIAEPSNILAHLNPALRCAPLPVETVTSLASLNYVSQTLSSGLGAAAVYSVAGKAAGGLGRLGLDKLKAEARLADTFGQTGAKIAKSLYSESAGQILGAGIYDLARDTQPGESRLSNAAAGMLTFGLYEKSNQMLRNRSVVEQLLGRAATGSFGAVMQRSIAQGKAPLTLKDGSIQSTFTNEELADSIISGGMLNVALPPLQHALSIPIAKANQWLGRGNPAERLGKISDPGFNELAEKYPFARIQITDKGAEVNHKTRLVHAGNVEEARHELTHIAWWQSPRAKQMLADARAQLIAGDETSAANQWKLACATSEHVARGGSADEVLTKEAVESIAKQKAGNGATYEELWQQDFEKFKQSEGKYRPEKEFFPKTASDIIYDAATHSAEVSHSGITSGELAQFLQKHPNLEQLSVNICHNITELPLQHLANLKTLNVYDCNNITELPLQHLAKLEKLTVNSCQNITELPLLHLANLRQLYVRCCQSITELPLQHLARLEQLTVKGCKNITELGVLPPGLNSVSLLNLPSLTALPTQLPPTLKTLVLDHCPKLKSLPKDLPAGLDLTIDGCNLLEANPDVQKVLAKHFDSLVEKWYADNIKLTAEMLKQTADAIVNLVPQNSTCVLLGRDSYPLVPLLRYRGIDARYFLWSRLQIGDKATAALWRQEIPANSIVIDTGYEGSILNDIKKTDPTISGYLMSSTGKYPEIPGLELDRGKLVQYIERFPKAIGRGTAIRKGTPVCKTNKRDIEEQVFSPKQSVALTKKLLVEMGLPEELAEKHKSFSGITKEERVGVGRYFIPGGHDGQDKHLPRFTWHRPYFYSGATPTEAGMQKLGNLGVDTIVSLGGDHEQGMTQSSGMKNVHIPVEGGRYLKPEQLDIFMKAVFTAKNTWKQASQEGKEGTLPATFVNCVDADK